MTLRIELDTFENRLTNSLSSFPSIDILQTILPRLHQAFAWHSLSAVTVRVVPRAYGIEELSCSHMHPRPLPVPEAYETWAREAERSLLVVWRD